MSKLRVGVLSFLVSLILFSNTSAQTLSSYSALGIGDFYLPAQANSQGMGGIGISNSNVLYQSFMNPALLADNQIYSFSAGAAAEDKSIWQNDNREKASGGNLAYLNMVLPIVPRRLSFSIGLAPYSRVNYNFSSQQPVEGNPDAEMELFNRGEGGFNQFIFSAGLNVTKGLYIGGKSSFVFSTIEQERNNLLSEPQGIYVPSSITSTTARDFIFGVGAAYKYKLTDQLTASLGLVYDFATDLEVTRTQTLLIKSNTNIPVRLDTLLDDESGFIHIPDNYGVGISITNSNIWTIGTDIRFQNWNDFKDYDGSNQDLINAMLIRFGGEITPNPSSVDNYFERITYRLGFNIDQTPYQISDTQIQEFGINFGLSLPVSNFSSVDMGFRYGSRGTTDNNLIREDFFRVYFGVTFNDNRWFIRPKYN